MIKVIVFAIAFAWSAAAFAQPGKVSGPPCDNPDCRNASYHYIFCDTKGNTVRKCSSDPNNEPGLKPYKRNTPLALCPQNLEMVGVPDRIRVIQYPPPTPLDPAGGPVLFNPDRIREKLYAAKKTWDDMCPPQGPSEEYQVCCLKVMWATTIEDMRGEPTAYANTHIRAFTYDGPPADHTCQFDCANSVMLLNRTREFMQPLDDGTPRKFFLTERENNPYQPVDFYYVDMQAIFEHELGHWLGFMHSDEEDDKGNVCQHNSIMFSGKGTLGSRIIPTVTSEDMCMFMKAYCCVQTIRRPDSMSDRGPIFFPPQSNTKITVTKGTGISVIPNPARSGAITLRLNMPQELAATRVRFVNAIGEVALERQITNPKSREIFLDVSALAKGMYVVQLVSDGWTHAQKILVE